MVRVDDGGGGPTLNAKAKHFERELFKVFEVQVGSISMTQTNWQDAKKQLDDLSKDVINVRGELQAPADGGKGWNGPAAEAALASLKKLSDTLDGHANKVADVDKSLGQIYTAVTEARSSYYSDVASISTYVDPDSHKRLPAPYLPTPENVAAYSVRDPDAAAAAEDALWEERNQKAKGVLDKLGQHTETATATMPIKPKSDTETPYTNTGPAASTPSTGTASQSSTSGGFVTGGHAVATGQVHPVDDGTPTGTEFPTPDPLPPVQVCTGYPMPLPPVDEVDYEPISSDGPVTGSTGVSPGTGPGSTGSYPSGGGSGVGAAGIAAGGVGGAAGLGGMLGNRGGGGMLNGGTARGGATGARGNAAGARGSAARAGGVGRPGGPQGIPGGGGAAARGGGSARGSAVKGSTGSGRYGVPKLGSNGAVAGGGHAGKGSGAGKGASGARGGRGGAAMGAAGAGGGRKGDKNGQPKDADKLTHEDEEKWFEGTEESSPQVWE